MKLTPTENLALEVLIARFRTGEHLWTFDDDPAIVRALGKLEDKKLVWTMHGSVEHTIRAGLTDKAKNKYVGDYTPPNGIQDPVALVQGMISHRNYLHNWQNDQRREHSTSVFGHGGSSVPPYWSSQDEEHAFIAYLKGERQPEFNGIWRDQTIALAEELGYSTRGKQWYLTILDDDLPAYGGNEYWGVWFEPNGNFFAAHSNKVHIQTFGLDEVARQEAFDAFLAAMSESRKLDLEDPNYQSRVRSQRRSRAH